MSNTTPKYRRTLNPAQLEVLELLYKFRFATTDLIAKYFDKSSGVFVYKRLQILQEQGYIIKRFDSSYRIQGKPAAYCLSAMGGRILKEHKQSFSGINVKALYKNKTISDTFVKHCLEVFAVHNQLKAEYGDTLKFFSKSELSSYDYFPQPLPDAYFRLKYAADTKHYFLNLYNTSQPFFTLGREVKKYIEYADGGDWDATDTKLPAMLLVCDTHSLQKRLQKFIASAINSVEDDDVKFALTTKTVLMNVKTAVWQLADEPEVVLSLDSIQ